MWKWMVLPFIVQAVCILLDEGVFHVKRGLPKWERIGHPLDTLSVLLCLFYILFFPFSSGALKGYIALALFSSIWVTKDEFVHKTHCPASENWLHAVLFTLHPITLALLGLIWSVTDGATLAAGIHFLFDNQKMLSFFLYFQTALMLLFFFYQVVFWNFIWKDKEVVKQ